MMNSPPRLMHEDDSCEMYWMRECYDTTDSLGRFFIESELGREMAADWFDPDRNIHNMDNCFLLKGAEQTLLYDNLGPNSTTHILDVLDDLIGDGSLDYVVISHDEAPHAANTHHVLDAYPEATLIVNGDDRTGNRLHELVLTDVDDYQFVDFTDTIELGGYSVEFVEPAILDTAMTMWMFEHSTKTIFTADSFGNPHHDDECDRFVDEMTPMTWGRRIQYEGRALPWFDYADFDRINDALDRIWATYEPERIASAHGNPVRENADNHFNIVKANNEWLAEHGKMETLTAFIGGTA